MSKRKVLVPIDGSDFSRQILRTVRSFFEADDVELILFRAAYPPVLPSEAASADIFAGGMPLAGTYEAYNRALDTTYSALEKERDQYRARLAEEIQPEVTRLREAGYTVRAQVDYGEPAQCIIDYVNDTGVDLVAMATHGRGGLGRLVLGSVAERVLRSVGVPVLLMRPAPAAAERPASAQLSKTLARGQTLQVVATTDGGPAANHAVLVAAQLAHAMRASLKVLVVANEREGAAHAQQLMAATHGLLENQSPRPEFAPLVGYTDDVVLQYLEKHPAGLLVVGPFQDRGAGTQSAIGPSAQRIVQQTGSSVLVVKGRRSSFTRVLVCADVDDDAAVQAGSQLAALLHANLDVVHVIAPPAAAYLSPGQSPDMSLDEAIAQGTRLSSVLQGWLDILSADGFDRSSLSLRRGNMPEKALELAHSGNYDLVVVGSRSSSGHFTGSAANNMVRYAECSVLIVRGKV